jgi:SAM-dependent methyltransferase
MEGKALDIELISRLNELWGPIYPHLAQWIGHRGPPKPQWVLELGPFSGGISRSLMIQRENVNALCLMPQQSVAASIRDQSTSGIQILVGSLEQLPFAASFDLAVFRGAFFFLTPQMIKEAYRILKPAGRGLLGGGYGPLTPPEEISRIAEESKRLNYRMGKRWISKAELEEMITDAQMAEQSEVLEEGGLWLMLRKD